MLLKEKLQWLLRWAAGSCEGERNTKGRGDLDPIYAHAVTSEMQMIVASGFGIYRPLRNNFITSSLCLESCLFTLSFILL